MKRSLSHRSTHQTQPGQQGTVQGASFVRKAEAKQQKERLLDAAYDEYCILRESGEPITASEFCDRYPTYRKSLRRLIDVHDTFSGFEGEDVWPEAGSHFLGFEILDLLGVGAIARVYLASELALGGRLVALKVSHFGGHEAETLGKLNHPHIVPVHSVQEDSESGLTAVCMPYLGSVTLADVMEVLQNPEDATLRNDGSGQRFLKAIEQREHLAGFCAQQRRQSAPDPLWERGTLEQVVLRIGVQLGQALNYTHARGILHRDLKPSNVLVTPIGDAMLLDFNLSLDSRQEINRWGGTLPYMPPEQLRDVFDGHQPPLLDARSDLFSLGVILYELLAGRLPFPEPQQDLPPADAAAHLLRIQEQTQVSLDKVALGFDSDIAELVPRCLSLDPHHRPASADALVTALSRMLEKTHTNQRLLGRRRWMGAASAGLSLAGIAGLGIWLSIPPYRDRQLQRGLEHLRRREWKEAEQSFQRSLLEEHSAAATLGRAVAALFGGDYDLASRDIREVPQTSTDPLLMESLAFCCFQSGNAEAAAYWFGEAAKIEHANAPLHLSRGFAFTRTRVPRYAQALRETNLALEIDPDFQAALHFRARINALLRGPSVPFDHDPLADLAKARRLGPPSMLLEQDSAHLHAILDENPDVNTIQQHLAAAVRLGLGRERLQRLLWLQPWRDEPWLVALVNEADPHMEPTVSSPFLRYPDLNALLEAILQIDSST